MVILMVLIGSFLAGILLQMVSTRFGERNSPGSRCFETWQRVREILHPAVVLYLLVHIGLIGGAEIAHEGLGSLTVPAIFSFGLALLLFIITLLALSCIQITDRETRISIATHFGSVSVGTFAAAQAFLQNRGISYAPSTSAWLALMEVPAILIGASMLGGGLKSLKDTFGDRDILVLLCTLILGFLLGHRLVHRFDFLLVTPFEGVLAYFLFDMGHQTGVNLGHLRQSGLRLIPFGILMAVCGGTLGGLVGTLFGLGIGNVVIVSTLSASASYVASTAVMGKLVSPEAIATTLTVSLGITLPWNILIGIQLYTILAQSLHAIQGNPYLIGLLLTWYLIIVIGGLFALPRLRSLRRLRWNEARQEG
ncbi:MAG: sodium-dependent bicarbonate transport family permease [bacterium]